MMKKTRRKIDAGLKAKIALEAVRVPCIRGPRTAVGQMEIVQRSSAAPFRDVMEILPRV
jgi:hypothetical protein